MTNAQLDGFYAVYLTGKVARGLAMLAFKGGRITGVDFAGVLFDGTYSELGNGNLSVSLLLKTPPNVQLIQGGNSGSDGSETKLQFEIPSDFILQPFIRIEGPRGPVNTKLVRLRGLSD